MHSIRSDAYPLQDIISRDVHSWKRALRMWEECLPDARDQRVLDVGARDGGLSLYWALRGSRVVCSDRGGPNASAKELHARYGVAERVTYAEVDATRMPLPDQSFDVVCFKSVLGGIGGVLGEEGQRQALHEMHRVLRPGGRLLFAENTTASKLHAFFRRRCVRWGGRWRYVTPAECAAWLSPFEEVRLQYGGFLAAFGRREWQRTILHGADVLLEPLIPAGWKYIIFGRARRGGTPPP